MSDGPLPLEGLTILDASTIIAGPICSLMMAEYGARVIKVEHPKYGDGARNLGTTPERSGLWWRFISRNKDFITCNLSQPRGAELFRELAKKADVVIENFRPGTMEKWGLGYDDLSKENPDLVMLRITGFGQDGPYSDRPGYGTLAESLVGLANMSGFPDGPPTLPPLSLADSIAGLTAFGACMTALWSRDRSERGSIGRVIDVSLYGPLMYILGMYYVEASVTGASPSRQGNRLGNAIRNAVACADGKWIAYSAQSPKIVRALVELLGLGDDERFDVPNAGYIHGPVLDARLSEWVQERGRSEALDRLRAVGIPAAPINDMLDVLADEHMTSRQEFVIPVDRSGQGSQARMPNKPFRMSGVETGSGTSAAPIGADTDATLIELLGLSRDQIADLRREGAI